MDTSPDSSPVVITRRIIRKIISEMKTRIVERGDLDKQPWIEDILYTYHTYHGWDKPFPYRTFQELQKSKLSLFCIVLEYSLIEEYKGPREKYKVCYNVEYGTIHVSIVDVNPSQPPIAISLELMKSVGMIPPTTTSQRSAYTTRDLWLSTRNQYYMYIGDEIIQDPLLSPMISSDRILSNNIIDVLNATPDSWFVIEEPYWVRMFNAEYMFPGRLKTIKSFISTDGKHNMHLVLENNVPYVKGRSGDTIPLVEFINYTFAPFVWDYPKVERGMKYGANVILLYNLLQTSNPENFKDKVNSTNLQLITEFYNRLAGIIWYRETKTFPNKSMSRFWDDRSSKHRFSDKYEAFNTFLDRKKEDVFEITRVDLEERVGRTIEMKAVEVSMASMMELSPNEGFIGPSKPDGALFSAQGRALRRIAQREQGKIIAQPWAWTMYKMYNDWKGLVLTVLPYTVFDELPHTMQIVALAQEMIEDSPLYSRTMVQELGMELVSETDSNLFVEITNLAGKYMV